MQEKSNTLKITVEVPGIWELIDAVNALAGKAKGQPAEPVATSQPQEVPAMQTPPMPQPVQQAPMQAIPVAPTAQTAPVAQAIPVAPVAQTPPMPQPMQQAPQMPQPIPTTAVAQEYTQDQIAVAMSSLVNMGKQPKVFEILAMFGAQTLVQVDHSRYAELATMLRQEGAVI